MPALAVPGPPLPLCGVAAKVLQSSLRLFLLTRVMNLPLPETVGSTVNTKLSWREVLLV